MKKLFAALAVVTASLLTAADLTVENKFTAFVFDPDNGCSLREIRNKETGKSIVFAASAPLWQAELLTGENTLSIAAPAAVKTRLSRVSGGQLLTANWKLNGKNPVTAEMKFFLPDSGALAEADFAITTAGKKAPWVDNVVFPVCGGIKSFQDDYLIVPYYYGQLIRNPGKGRQRSSYLHHPGSWSMQMVAFFGSDTAVAPTAADGTEITGYLRGTAADETGFILACDDEKNFYKELRIDKNPQFSGTFDIRTSHYPALPDWPAVKAKMNGRFSYKMPYKVKIGTFSGGVGKAAAVYRDIVKDHHALRLGKLDDPANPISSKIKNLAYWGKHYHGANRVLPDTLRMWKFFRAPTAIHWPRYTSVKFDHNNLDYHPLLAEFETGVRTLRQLGIVTAPYVCACMWDQDIPSYKRKNMAAAATRDRHGAPYLWPIAEANNAWMNPASPLWRKEYADLTIKLQGQWQTDSQYMDVLACGGKLCYDPALKTIGGGNYWAAGNRKMLQDIRKRQSKLEKHLSLTTEGFTEGYIDLIDAYLILDITRYAWTKDIGKEFFPFFAYVYHDYAIAYGSDVRSTMPADMIRWQMGLSWQAGIQPCMMGSYFRESKVTDRFNREIIHARHRAAAKFLNRGRGLEVAQVPDLKFAGKSAIAAAASSHQVADPTEKCISQFSLWKGPAVLTSAWQASDNSIGVTMVNISGKAQQLKLQFAPDRLPANAGNILWRSWPLPVKKLGNISDNKVLDLAFNADQAMVIELRDDTPPEITPLLPVSASFAVPDKDGNFPAVVNDTGSMLGGEEVLAEQSGNGKVRIISPLTFKPVTCIRRDWINYGVGGPRHEKYRTFYLLNPTGWNFSGKNYKAQVRAVHGIVSMILNVRSAGTLTAPDGTVIYAVSKGNIRTGKGKLELAPGEYFVFGCIPPAGTAPVAGTYKALAELSRQAAANGTALLSGGDELPREQRLQGEYALELGNAAAFVLTGMFIVPQMESDLLVPGVPQLVKFAGAVKGSVSLLNTHRRKQLDIAERDGGFYLTVNTRECTPHLLRVLYTETLGFRGEKVTRTALEYLEAGEGLRVDVMLRDAIVRKFSGVNGFTQNITLTNCSAQAQKIRISAELPEGVELLPVKEFTLKPNEPQVVKLQFKAVLPPVDKVYPCRILVHYSDVADAAVPVEFKLRNYVADLKPVVDGGKVSGRSNRMRDDGGMVCYVGSDRKISFRIIGVNTPVFKTKTYEWTLFDRNMQELNRGKGNFDSGEKQIVTINVPEPGVYFVRLKSSFFFVQMLTPQSYGFMATENEPFHASGTNRNVDCYFHVGNGESFYFCAQDGGKTEPAQVIITDPSGKVVFERNGNFSKSEKINIPVAPQFRDKVWKLYVAPVDDFAFHLGGSAAEYIATEPECTLKK